MDPNNTAEHWQAKSSTLANVLLDRIGSGTESLKLGALLEMDIPELVRSYAALRAQKLLASAKPVRLEGDGSQEELSPEVRRQLQMLKDCLLRETVFTRADLAEIVVWGVTFQLQVLVRPRQQLMEVLFRNSEVAVRDTVMTLLHGFRDQRAFVRKLLHELAGLESETIEAEGFDALARLAERNVFAETPVSAFLTDVRLLLDFESEVAGMPKERLSSSDVSGLLIERGLNQVLHEGAPELRKTSEWPLEKIESSLAHHFFGHRTKTQRYNAPGRAIKTKAKAAAAAKQTALFDFREEGFPLVTATEGTARRTAPGELLPGNGADNAASLHTPNGGDAEPRERTPSLPEKEARLIRNVFYNNEQEYRSFLARLDSLGTANSRRAAVEQELIARDVSPFSEEAALLTELVSARFKRDESP